MMPLQQEAELARQAAAANVQDVRRFKGPQVILGQPTNVTPTLLDNTTIVPGAQGRAINPAPTNLATEANLANLANRADEVANRAAAESLAQGEIARTAEAKIANLTANGVQPLNINTVNGATISPPAKIDEALVVAILNVSYTDISNISELKNWIYLITNTEKQTLTDRLAYLNILANSLNEAMKTSNHALTKAYLYGLYSQILKWIHETLDLVEWLCKGDYEKLPIPLLREFKTCKSLHMWKSKNN
jgi:hypothetical protein